MKQDARIELSQTRFWQLRTEHLFSRELQSRVVDGCWRETYHLLQEVRHLHCPIFHSIENQLAVRVLLEVGSDPALKQGRAVARASRLGQIEVVRLLVEYRSETCKDEICLTSGGNEALVWARERGHTEIEQLLLADPRVRDKERELGRG